MGLDMYLKAEKYISGWDHSKNEAKEQFAKIIDAAGLDSEDIATGSPSGTLSLNVMYWRKANAIHNWFVKYVQNDVDNCKEYYVHRDDLKILITACTAALNDKNAAPEVLPTKSGFFFGPTEYDEYYYQDLQETVDRLGKLLMDPKFEGWDFKYQSSW